MRGKIIYNKLTMNFNVLNINSLQLLLKTPFIQGKEWRGRT